MLELYKKEGEDMNGSTATVMYDNYGQGFEANSTVGNIYMHVTGVDPFSLE